MFSPWFIWSSGQLGTDAMSFGVCVPHYTSHDVTPSNSSLYPIGGTYGEKDRQSADKWQHRGSFGKAVSIK